MQRPRANGSSFKLQSRRGEEPQCPACGRYNAMLDTLSFPPGVLIRECRDCHLIVGCTGPDFSDARVIARSLGKQCSRCRSFAMKETTLGSWMFKCQDCDAPAVKY